MIDRNPTLFALSPQHHDLHKGVRHLESMFNHPGCRGCAFELTVEPSLH